MFVLEEPEHLRRRRLLTPPLHGDALDSYVPIIESTARSAMKAWPVGRPMRILEAARELTLDVIVQVIFGVSDPAAVTRLGKPFEELLELALSEETPVRYAMRRFGALRRWGKLAEVNRSIDELVLPLIADRRSDPRCPERTDILSMMVNARTEDGDRLSDNEIRDDVITLMLAGHETTATTLAWLIDCDPPAPVTGRMTTGRYQLGDYTLDAGVRIVLLLDVVNRDPKAYPNPDEFRPERFLGARPHPYAWVPFGGGIKRCIGAAFSMCELTTTVHTILRESELEPVSARQESPPWRAAPVVVPRDGTRVVYAPASRSATQPSVGR